MLISEPPYQPEGSALLAAVNWLTGTLLGSVATALAMVAIALVGLSMLTGRMQARAAAQVALGCFLLFGASSIASGLMAFGRSDGEAAAPPWLDIQQAPAPRALPTPPGYDPYAGASVPQ